MSETEQVLIVKENPSPRKTKDAINETVVSSVTQVKYIAGVMSRVDENKTQGTGDKEAQNGDVTHGVNGSPKEQDKTGKENGHLASEKSDTKCGGKLAGENRTETKKDEDGEVDVEAVSSGDADGTCAKDVNAKVKVNGIPDPDVIAKVNGHSEPHDKDAKVNGTSEQDGIKVNGASEADDTKKSDGDVKINGIHQSEDNAKVNGVSNSIDTQAKEGVTSAQVNGTPAEQDADTEKGKVDSAEQGTNKDAHDGVPKDAEAPVSEKKYVEVKNVEGSEKEDDASEADAKKDVDEKDDAQDGKETKDVDDKPTSVECSNDGHSKIGITASDVKHEDSGHGHGNGTAGGSKVHKVQEKSDEGDETETKQDNAADKQNTGNSDDAPAQNQTEPKSSSSPQESQNGGAAAPTEGAKSSEAES